MTPTDLYNRNTAVAIDVLIRRMDPQIARRKYRIARSTFQAVLIHLAHCALGAEYRHLEQMRDLVSDRLADECLRPDRAQRPCRIGASGTG